MPELLRSVVFSQNGLGGIAYLCCSIGASLDVDDVEGVICTREFGVEDCAMLLKLR